MRILIVVHAFPPESTAGTELLALHTLKTLKRQGHLVGLLAPYFQLPQKSVVPGNLCHEDIFLFQKYPKVELWQDWSGRARRFFKRTLADFRPDLVYFFHTLFLSYDLPLIAKRFGAKVIFELHDYYLACPRGTLLARNSTRSYEINRAVRCTDCLHLANHSRLRWLPFLKPMFGRTITRLLLKHRDHQTRQLFQQVDLFIAPSKTLASVMNNFGIPAEKLYHLPYGLPPLQPSPQPPIKLWECAGKANGTITRPLRFGFIGSITKHKGVAGLIKAWQYLEEDSKNKKLVPTELHLFGPLIDPTELSQWLSYHSVTSISYHSSFDYQNTQAVYNFIDVLIVPSRWFENQPLVILQAIQTQTPIITANLGGMAELVKHQQNGLLFIPDSSRDLAHQLRLIIKNPSLILGFREQLAKQRVPTINWRAEQVLKRLTTNSANNHNLQLDL